MGGAWLTGVHVLGGHPEGRIMKCLYFISQEATNSKDCTIFVANFENSICS